MRAKLQQFMVGRYGQDLMNRDMTLGALVLCVLSMFTGVGLLSSLALALLIFGYYRMLSRNIEKRREEAEGYERLRGRVTGFFSLQKRQLKEHKTHRYYACPSCQQQLRVPKGKGAISIHCPKCQTDFEKKT